LLACSLAPASTRRAHWPFVACRRTRVRRAVIDRVDTGPKLPSGHILCVNFLYVYYVLEVLNGVQHGVQPNAEAGVNTATVRWRAILAAGLAVVGLAAAAFLVRHPVMPSASGTTSSAIPAPVVDEPATGRPKAETAVLAGGCFWGVQGVFQHVKGVIAAESGYAGGGATTADYETVSTGSTGHAESVRLTYDPAQVTYGKLLQIFFAVVQDPTELNRQGPDVGTQYRSVIFAQDETQRNIADAYIAQLNQAGAFPAPIVTAVSPGTPFFPAEAYHQDFFDLNPNNPYIVQNDLPKLDALRSTFPDLYRG
jgi:peptide-methionine (S)-S-oxide reductase